MALRGEFAVTPDRGDEGAGAYSAEFGSVEGYYISACMNTNGFSDAFFIYVWDRVSAGNSGAATGLPDRGRVRGELTLIDGDRVGYTFSDIQLRSVTRGRSRRERFRLYEFGYDAEVMGRESTPIRLQNKETRESGTGALGDQYKYGLSLAANNQSEHLLGQSDRVSPDDGTVLRFSALRNQKNSFLECAIKMHEGRIQGGTLPELNIDFTQHPISVNQQNLQFMLVEEACGELLSYSSRPLGSVAGFESGDIGQLARLDPDRIMAGTLGELSAAELLRHENSPNFKGGASDPLAVETATIKFGVGHYRDIAIS